MKRSNVKSRIKKDELNPVFHFKDKEEDDKVLTKGVIKQALKSGKLELSSKNLKFGEWKRRKIDLIPPMRCNFDRTTSDFEL
jgi:hypothetical protein